MLNKKISIISNIFRVISLNIIIILISSCSSETVLKNDAIRIKPNKVNEYNQNKKTNKPRNGSTLRGKAIKIRQETFANSCPIEDTTTFSTKSYLMFLDSNASDKSQVEKIPMDDIFTIGTELKIPKNKWGNINYFETYNDPLLPKSIREVGVDSIYIDTCSSTPCPCNDFNMDLEIPCLFCFKCPERILDDYFVEGKLGYGLYNELNAEGVSVGNEGIAGEVATGWRFGEGKRYGLGLLYSTGMPTTNLYDGVSNVRSMVAIYTRYDLWRYNKRIEKTEKVNIDDYIYLDTIKINNDECLDTMIVVQKYKPLPETEVIYTSERGCWNPFVYGFMGASLDKLSMNLFKFNCTEGCEDKLNLDPNANFNFSMPLNYGIGIGIEYPLSQKLDLSLDIGYRYLSYGNSTIINGFIAPINESTNAFVFRIGITY
ncbi:MAG: outer membrane protein [Candidatus Kapaibacteriota bacterium]|jgi:hypothetical protein